MAPAPARQQPPAALPHLHLNQPPPPPPPAAAAAAAAV
jgi:hypothetical protein